MALVRRSLTRALIVNEAGDAITGGTTVVTGNVEVTNDVGNPLPVSGTVAVTGAVEIANDVGNPIPVNGTVTITLPTAQRTQGIARLTTGVTTPIAAGKRSFTVTVVAAASAASPTLDGVALPVGYTGTLSADGNNTLAASSLVTVVGDDVILLTVA